MKFNIFKYSAVALSLFGFASCMDFDTPSDEFASNTETIDPTVYVGDADALDYTVEPSKEDVEAAVTKLKPYLGQLITAQYYLLGGKDGNMPAEHQYQYVYNLTTDAYAGYTTCTQSWGGKMETTYSYSRDFCEGPYGRMLSMKNNLANILNIDESNSIVEIKAIALLLFDYVAQENTDIYGSVPYVDHKSNKETNPFTFNRGLDIYYSILKNLDDIDECLDNYSSRPDWYKAEIAKLLTSYDALTIDKSLDSWRRFANSLKLRMGMHLVKVDPAEAKRICEEAVASGVVEQKNQQIGLNPLTNCFNAHPMKVIMNSWSDCRINASFMSIMESLNHPYLDYMVIPINGDLVNTATGAVTTSGSAKIGLRAGIRMENGQQYYANMRVAYSQFSGEDFEFMPLYAIKWAEIDFLRAEGAVRGWDMGGTPEFFYERGIRNADCADVFSFPTGNYDSRVDDYLAQESATDFTYIDPMDDSNKIESLTKIGVKWNDSDDPETKLEKIITQKWIALFPYSYEAWTDVRRTGYPKLFPVLNVNMGDGSLKPGDIIRRGLLPHGDTQAGMDDIQTSGLEAIGGPDQQATRVFWDTEAANF